MDDLLEVVSTETNEFRDSHKTAFAGWGIWSPRREVISCQFWLETLIFCVNASAGPDCETNKKRGLPLGIKT
jgi:hypothetical protein